MQICQYVHVNGDKRFVYHLKRKCWLRKQQKKTGIEVMLVKKNRTWTESWFPILVAQRQAALSSVSFGSLPQGQADTAADTRKGDQSRFRKGDQSNTEANATTSALVLPILL